MALCLAACGGRKTGQGADLASNPLFLGETRQTVVSALSRPWVFWLDSRTLIFAGAEPGDSPQRGAHLYLWHVGHEPVIYAANRWPSRVAPYLLYLCVADGQVTYSTAPATQISQTRDRAVYRAPALRGPVGAEQPMSLDIVADASKPRNISPYGETSVSGRRCDGFTLGPEHRRGRVWDVNYRRDRYLDFGPNDAPSPSPRQVAYGRLDATPQERILPIAPVHKNPAEPFCVEAPAWNNGFVFWQCLAPAPGRPDTNFYELDDQGRLTTLTTRTTTALMGATLAPAKRGLFLATEAAWSPNQEQEAGLYRIEPSGNMRRIVPGLLEVAAISPDGCLGAFYKANSPNYYVRSQRLVLLDLCKANAGQ